MATAKARGTKRTCQSAECGLPFYDLNRASFACPTCGTNYDLEAAARAAAEVKPGPSSRRSGHAYPVVAPTPEATDAAAPEDVADVEIEEEADGSEAALDTAATILEVEDDEEPDAADIVPLPEDGRDET